MNTSGVLLMAALSAISWTDDFLKFDGKAHVGGMKLLRHHVVRSGPATGMPGVGYPGMGMGSGMGGGMGPGCNDPANCGPGGMMGAGGPGGPGGGAQGNRRFATTKSQLNFVGPAGMNIGWQTSAPGADRVYLPSQLVTPARYNFMQGFIYRLKLTNIPGRVETPALYPTLEVAPSTPETDAYLSHNPIPVEFSEEDLDQVKAGNFLTKVIYLPDPKFQEVAVAGVETLVSTRLEPGVDPIIEADKRGTILLIVRLGAIDLENSGYGSPTIAAPVSGPVLAPMAPVTVPSDLPITTPNASEVGGAVPFVNSPIVPAPAASPVVPAPTPAPAEAPAPAPAAAPGGSESPR